MIDRSRAALVEDRSRSWASRAALSRSAHLEGTAESALRGNSNSNITTNSGAARPQFATSLQPVDERFNAAPAQASRAIGSVGPTPPTATPTFGATTASNFNTNTNTSRALVMTDDASPALAQRNGNDRQVGVATTGEAITGRDRSIAAGALDFGAFDEAARAREAAAAAAVPARHIDASPTLVSIRDATSQPASRPYEPLAAPATAASSSVVSPTSMGQHVRHVAPAPPQQHQQQSPLRAVPPRTALVDISGSPVIPTRRGYSDFFREARETGGLGVTPPDPRSRGAGAGAASPWQQPQLQHGASSASTTASTSRPDRDHVRDRDHNRTLDCVADDALVFLHQAYGDPTLSVATHWLLLHQNLVDEQVVHWKREENTT